MYIHFFLLQHFSQIFSKSPKQPILSSLELQHWPVRTARAVLTGPYSSWSEQASLGNLGMTKSDVVKDLRKNWEKRGSKKNKFEKKEKRQLNHLFRLSVFALADCEWRAAASG